MMERGLHKLRLLPLGFAPASYGEVHLLINCTDALAKCRHLKKLTCKGSLKWVSFQRPAGAKVLTFFDERGGF